MTVKVVGAGLGRTGTLSLKQALERLGFDKCYHMYEVMGRPDDRLVWLAAHRGEPVDWHALFEGYQATVDWPSCRFWREQLEAFPEAKVILSRRDPKAWYKSVMNTIWKMSKIALERAPDELPTQMAMSVIWDHHFDRRMDDEAHVIAQFEAHNQAVIDEVPADRLLVYEPGEGWEPICQFLNVPVPDEDYPRTNTTEEFESIFRPKPGSDA